jgi:hypothetical protein
MESSKKQETVVIQDYPRKMAYVQAQPHTHFRLKNKSDRQKLLNVIDSISDVVGPITASYDYGRKYDTDVIIRKKSDSNSVKPIGKIHFLLFDRRDRYNHEKYYMKLHFFQFANDALFERVKQAVTAFFQGLAPTAESYMGNSTRKNTNRKLTKIVNRNQTLKNSSSNVMKIDEQSQ